MKTKFVPLIFSYLECDGLARYLERQAEKGWHFKAFRLGLEFEKGEPRRVTYDVQTFLKNKETDTAPEPETEEFAAYCEAAGWEFADSTKRFLVFRKDRWNAQPIYTGEERLQCVFRSELRARAEHHLSMLLLFVCFLFNASLNPPMWLFNGVMQVLLIYAGLSSALGLIRVPALFFWRAAKKRELQKTGTITCPSRPIRRTAWLMFRLFPLFPLAWMVLGPQGGPVVWAGAVSVVLLGTAIAWFRPGRGENRLIQIAGGIGVVLIIFLTAAMVMMSAGPVKQDSLSGAPLLVRDLRKVTGEPESAEFTRQSSSLGSLTVVTEHYPEDGVQAEAELDLRLYRFSGSGAEDTIWQYETGRYRLAGAEDVSAAWGASEAWHNTVIDPYGGLAAHWYYLRYEGTTVVLHVSWELSAEQIAIVRAKLGV